MGTSTKVNKESCYVTVIYTKLASLDKDLKTLYQKRVTAKEEYLDRIDDSIKYFQNEKRFWFGELQKNLDKLDY